MKLILIPNIPLNLHPGFVVTLIHMLKCFFLYNIYNGYVSHTSFILSYADLYV